MRRPLTVDVARTLPAEASRTDPPPQRAGTDHNALCVQMCGEQWHGPGVGVIPELARVAREQLTELGIHQGRRRARTTGSFAISQRRWRSFGKIALDPAIDRAAFNTRMLGDDGNRLAFCNLGNCPKAPIKSGVMRLLKRSQQTSTLRPTERRIARSGCVHPDTIGSACACRKTSGNLLSRVVPSPLRITVPASCYAGTLGRSSFNPWTGQEGAYPTAHPRIPYSRHHCAQPLP